ncbi:hypothetical protein Afe04nite_47970 [Asanoa ferruginea]|nr:hypothetical protein Afe04nite_47970 [Asanoa ferruginea]
MPGDGLTASESSAQPVRMNSRNFAGKAGSCASTLAVLSLMTGSVGSAPEAAPEAAAEPAAEPAPEPAAAAADSPITPPH